MVSVFYFKECICYIKGEFFFIIIWFLRNISPVICFGSKAVYFSKNVETNIDEISPAVSMKTINEKSKYE